jgi:hypothetical protein
MSRVICAALLLSAASLAAGAGAASAAAAATAAKSARRAKPVLVTAFPVKTDKLGFRWDLQPNGVIADGTGDCFDSGQTLTVNGSNFPSSGGYVIGKGSGYRMEATIAGLKVTRRVIYDLQRSALRYLEVFENPGKTAVVVTAVLSTRLGNSSRQVVTNAGTSMPNSLGRAHIGLLAISRDARPSVMFLLAAGNSKLKPSLTVSNRRYYAFTYRFTVDPGKTVSIAHMIAQRRCTGAQQARRIFKPFCRVNRLLGAAIPEKLKPSVLNFSEFGTVPPDPGPLLAGVTARAEELSVERGALGVLAFKEGESVSGKLSCEKLEVVTAYGTASFTLDEVALISGGAGAGRLGRVYLRNGEVFCGRIRATQLTLRSSLGLEMILDPERIEALFTPRRNSDGKPGVGAVAYLQSLRGDRLALSAEQPLKIEAATAWGTLRVPLEKVRRLEYISEPRPGHRLELEDGSRFSVILRGKALKISSPRFGALSLDLREIGGIRRVSAGKLTALDQPATTLKVPYCRLVGGEVLAGTVDLPSIGLLTTVGRTVLKTKGLVSMTRSDDQSPDMLLPVFSFKLADGHTISGVLERSTLPVRSGARSWSLPTWHLDAVIWKPAATGPAGKPGGSGAGSTPPPVAAVAAAAPAVVRTTSSGGVIRFGSTGGGVRHAGRPAGLGGLVPIKYQHRTDALGFRWDVQRNGSINDGTSDCFDGGLILTVNSKNFNPTLQLMNPRTSEYVFSGKVGAVMVTRRVLVDLKASATRFVETFTNTGSVPVTMQVYLSSNLGNSAQATYSNTGTPNPATFGKNDFGVLAQARPGSRPSVIFVSASRGAKVKPTMNISGLRRFTAYYTMNLAPRRTASVMHIVAQRRMGTSALTPKEVAKLFKPFTGSRWFRGLSGKVRASIVNMSAGGGTVEVGASLISILNALAGERGKSDTLVFGKRTRLLGTASCRDFSVLTRFGRLELAFKQVAALAGSGHSGGQLRVLLRDGRILHGKVRARGLRFTADVGPVIDLEPAAVDRMVMRKGEHDGDVPEGAVAVLETIEGDRLVLMKDPQLSVPLVSPWGQMNVKLKDIQSLRPHSDCPGYEVRLLDGSRFFAFASEGKLTLRTHSFGKVRLNICEVRAITATRGTWRRASEESEDLRLPHLSLAGGSVLVGRVELPKLHMVTAGRVMAIPPGQIRSIRRGSQGGGDGVLVFDARLWGGGTVAGRFREAILPVRMSNKQICRIPVRDVEGIFVPVSALSGALRARIDALIRELGHQDWEQRETASSKLKEMGRVARPLVERAMRMAKDPEVRRRLRFLLEEMK